ncbi:hypothetical protein MHK_010109, partial [Candidatus Magnetomorum sp. HK-1]
LYNKKVIYDILFDSVAETIYIMKMISKDSGEKH